MTGSTFCSLKKPVVQQRRVSVLNKHGKKLVGILHDTAGSKELVLVCHGLRSSKDRITMVNLADALAKEGISAFRFDFAGNEESKGLFRYSNCHNEADDVHAVVQHFCGQDYAITAIVAHSKGWNAAILYGANNRDVPILVNISGRINLQQGIERGFGKDFLHRWLHRRYKQKRGISVSSDRREFDGVSKY